MVGLYGREPDTSVELNPAYTLGGGAEVTFRFLAACSSSGWYLYEVVVGGAAGWAA